MGRMWEARVEVGVRAAQLHRAAEEALDVGGDLAGVVGQVGLGVALAHRHDELVEGHRCARRRRRLSISRSRCEEAGLRGEGAQASMAIVRPVSDFISVSLIASGAWSEMNGMSPLMPMMPRRGFSRGERVRVQGRGVARRSLRAKFAREAIQRTTRVNPEFPHHFRISRCRCEQGKLTQRTWHLHYCAAQHRRAEQRVRGGVARLQLTHHLKVRPCLRWTDRTCVWV